MPNQDDTGELDLDLESEETEEETEESEESTESESSKDGDKRIKDLQSKADRAEARANKAEKLLAQIRGQNGAPGSNDPEREAMLVELREASLDAIYGEYPQLKDYSIDRSLIEGSTRAEMRESATSLVALIKSVATKARNKALSDAGVSAEPVSGTRRPPKDFASMSDEEFEKEIARARSGGADFTW